MKSKVFSVVLAALAATGFAQTWSTLVTNAELMAGNGGSPVGSPGVLTAGPNGVLALVNNNTVLRVDPSGSPKVEAMANYSGILAAIHAANPSLSSAYIITVTGVGFNTSGQLVIVTDQTADSEIYVPASLLVVDSTSPYAVHCLCTQTGSTSSPLQGARNVVMNGNTAYVQILDTLDSGAVPALRSVNTAVTVDDGSVPANLLLSSSSLPYRDGEMLDASTLVLTNAYSAFVATPQDVVKVDLSGTPAASVLIGQTNLATAIGKQVATVAMTTANGQVYLFEDGGAMSSYASGVITASNFVPPGCTAALQTEADIAASVGLSSFTAATQGFAYDSANHRLVAAVRPPSVGAPQTIIISRSVGAPSSIQDWSLME